jgi:hypothetical protein
MNQTIKTEKRPENQTTQDDPQIRFAFRLANNGEVTAERGQTPTKNNHTPIATRHSLP